MLAVCKALMGKFEIVSIGFVDESLALAMNSNAHRGSKSLPGLEINLKKNFFVQKNFSKIFELFKSFLGLFELILFKFFMTCTNDS